MIVKLLITLAFILSILVPFGAFAAGEKSRGRYKRPWQSTPSCFLAPCLCAVHYSLPAMPLLPRKPLLP